MNSSTAFPKVRPIDWQDIVINGTVSNTLDSVNDVFRKANLTIDCRGYKCPHPILFTQRWIKHITPGQTLCVISTDSGSVLDFQIFANKTGHALVAEQILADCFIFLIRKQARE